jgi:hypothetical protein
MTNYAVLNIIVEEGPTLRFCGEEEFIMVLYLLKALEMLQ